MALEIKQFSSEQVVHECAKRLIELLPVSPIPTLLLISGGSCLTLLPDILTEISLQQKDVSKVIVGFVDERFDRIHSNYATMIRNYSVVVEALKAKGVTFIDTSPHEEDQYEMADWYNEKLSALSFQLSAHDGKLITLLGMGSDGHIAGILPFPDNEKETFDRLFVNTKKLIIAYDATGKNKYSKRFTLTFQGIALSDYTIGFITGEQKKKVLEKINAKKVDVNTIPATYFNQTNQRFEIFTDVTVSVHPRVSAI